MVWGGPETTWSLFLIVVRFAVRWIEIGTEQKRSIIVGGGQFQGVE